MTPEDQAILLRTSIEVEAMEFVEVVDHGFETMDVLPLMEDQKQLLILTATQLITHLVTHGIKLHRPEEGIPPVQ